MTASRTSGEDVCRRVAEFTRRSGQAGPVPFAVRDAMVTRPKTCSVTTTVAQAHRMFDDDHVHTLLLVHGERLITVVDRIDLAGRAGHQPAAQFGSTAGRLTAPEADLETVFRQMIDRSVRRLAVVDGSDNLLGLLCLKRTLRGFCSDEDVLARSSPAGESAARR